VVCGDFNNTAFSYLYQKFQDRGLVDSFEEAGSGFGRTYDFPYFPFRIDYILADPYFKITSHKVYTGRDYSDHFPIRATLKKRQ
jgi:endonuclease/exonuclease/phosphatase